MLLGVLRGAVRLARRVVSALSGGGSGARRALAIARPPRQVIRRRTRLATWLAGVGVAVFGALGWLVGTEAMSGVDLAISSGIQELEGALVEESLRAISGLGSPVGTLGLAAAPVLLWRIGHRLASRFAAAALLAPIVGINLLKQVWLRPRPGDELVEVLGDSPAGSSFPSGHTLLYVSFFGFLLYWTYTFVRPGRVRTALLWTFGALIGLVGLARVYLGHHWASDVLAAYALGLAWLVVLVQFYARARLNRTLPDPLT
jgi:undecaprenyl-diphosphatase